MIIHEFFRWLALITGWPVQLVFFKRKTYYEDRREQGRVVKGNALIISNHYSVFDYMVNLFLFPFRKLYVVNSEWIYQKGKFFHWGMKCFGGIRSDRDIMGMRFIDEAIKTLERGKLVQIYPEAKITTTGDMMDFKTSYILIALRSGAPIIPVIIDGNYGLFKRAHIIVGKKIYLDDYCTSQNPTREEIVALNDMVYAKCKALKADLEGRIERNRRKRSKRTKEN